MTTITLLLLVLTSLCMAMAKVRMVTENGFEHPDITLNGFVLHSVFTQHTDHEMNNVVTRRQLQFNEHSHLLKKSTHGRGLATNSLPFPFNNIQQEFRALDTTPKLNRNKIRALAKLTFLNAQGAREGALQNVDTVKGYKWVDLKSIKVTDEMSGKDVPFSSTGSGSSVQYKDAFEAYNQKVVNVFAAAVANESNAVANSNNDTIRNFDVPDREGGQGKIGLVSLLYQRGDEVILAWRDTISSGDTHNIEAWMTSQFADSINGMGKYLMDNWKNAGLAIDSTMKARSEENDLKERAILQGVFYIKKYDGKFEEDLVKATANKAIGGKVRNTLNNGKVTMETKTKIALTEDEARKQGYWEVTKQIIETLHTEIMGGDSSKNLLITGHSQGGGRAQLHRMYLQKKHNMRPPVVTFGAVGPACFSRKLDGPGRTNMLDDVDPTVFYEDMTDYQHFLDPWGSALGQDVGTSCHLGKSNNSVELLKKTNAYKYCKEIIGYSGAKLIVGIYVDKKEPMKDYFSMCKFLTHTQVAIMMSLGDDILNEDGTTAFCSKYEPNNLTCPTQSEFIAGLLVGTFVLVMLLVCLVIVCISCLLSKKLKCLCFSSSRCNVGCFNLDKKRSTKDGGVTKAEEVELA